MIAEAPKSKTVAGVVDHLLLGIANLDRGIDWVEQRTGLRAAMGGVHPGAGTRNALLSLGPGRYLEIIALDPAQSTYHPRIDIRGFSEPRLATFAASTKDIEATAEKARRAGYKPAGPRDGSRRTPSGELLRWRTLDVPNEFGIEGIQPVPFFIQWAPDSLHPSRSAPGGCELEAMELHHPEPAGLEAALRAFGIECKVSRADTARITATLKTPKGRVELS